MELKIDKKFAKMFHEAYEASKNAPPDSTGGYSLPEGAQKELRWCWDVGVAKVTFNRITGKTRYYLADGSEIIREVVNGRQNETEAIDIF